MSKAIESGDTQSFKDTIKAFDHVQVNQLPSACDRFGCSLVHQCAYFQRLDMLQYMIKSYLRSTQKVIMAQHEQLVAAQKSDGITEEQAR